MKTNFLICCVVGFLVSGCSKSTDSSVQKEIPKKTLSGIFEDKSGGLSYFQSLDFRTDGTLLFKMLGTDRIKTAMGTSKMTLDGDGKGNYTIQDDKVIADYAFVASISYSPSYGTPPKILDPQTNQRIFRIDGDDLIGLAVIVPGEKTNSGNEIRWIKKK